MRCATVRQTTVRGCLSMLDCDVQRSIPSRGDGGRIGSWTWWFRVGIPTDGPVHPRKDEVLSTPFNPSLHWTRLGFNPTDPPSIPGSLSPTSSSAPIDPLPARFPSPHGAFRPHRSGPRGSGGGACTPTQTHSSCFGAPFRSDRTKRGARSAPGSDVWEVWEGRGDAERQGEWTWRMEVEEGGGACRDRSRRDRMCSGYGAGESGRWWPWRRVPRQAGR